jgi:hypothetical protein
MTLRSVLVSLLVTSALAGCSTTRYYQRERLVDHAALFDRDRLATYLRDKVEAAREGSFGGFGGSAAGGCGCE